MKLHIFRESNVRVPRQKLAAMFAIIDKAESKSGQKGHVNLVLTTDSRLRAMNGQFRDINHTTDVLSFNIDSPVDDDSTFGEIYIAVPTATRQAKQFGATLSQELLRLTCHGLLHLFGHEHDNEKQRDKMESLEARYLGSVGEGRDA